MLKLGDEINVERVFKPEEVLEYCRLINCNAVYHLTSEGGRVFGFEDMVVPAMFVLALTSTLKELDSITNLCLEKSRLYTCVRPIYVNRKYNYNYRVVEFDDATGTFLLKISVKNEYGKICLMCDYQLVYKK